MHKMHRAIAVHGVDEVKVDAPETISVPNQGMVTSIGITCTSDDGSYQKIDIFGSANQPLDVDMPTGKLLANVRVLLASADDIKDESDMAGFIAAAHQLVAEIDEVQG